MRIALRMLMAAACGLAILPFSVGAADSKPAPTNAPSPESKAVFKDSKEKASYAVGLYFGNQIKNALKGGNLDVEQDVLLGTIKDVLNGKDLKMTQQEVNPAITGYQVEVDEKQGNDFLAKNKTKDGVKTKTITLADGKTAELQYKVIKDGTGDLPKTNDTVSVNYRGTLVNGQEFDNSAKHGNQPQKLAVAGVIKGWGEALQMMKVGSKWELYIPPALAYGSMGRRGIPPASTLIFEMELVGTEPTPPPSAPKAAPVAPQQQSMTSDIIKVPSADELKKGAKIEVIKAEDAAKMAQQDAGKATNSAPTK